MDIQTVYTQYVNDGIIAGKSPMTLKGYSYVINRLVDYIRCRFLPQQTETLNTSLLTDYFIDGVQCRKWSRYTQWTHHKVLLSFFAWAVKHGYMPQNPIEGLPKPRLPQQPPKSFSEPEIMTILRTVANMPTEYSFTRARNKAIICLFVYTGLRRSEVRNLQMPDVDLVQNWLTVQHGKGDKRREVPLEQTTLVPVLHEYVEHRTRLCKTSPWFFTGTFSGRCIGEQIAISTLDRLFTKMNSICHLSKRISAHKLRHSFATLLLEKGADIFTVQQLMGHADISTTCIYLSSSRSKKVETIQKLCTSQGVDIALIDGPN